MCIGAQNMKSGSTVLLALVRGSRLWVAWAGDSQALLVRSGQPVTMMRPHKPDSPDERRRIELAGGCVLFLGASLFRLSSPLLPQLFTRAACSPASASLPAYILYMYGYDVRLALRRVPLGLCFYS